MKDRLEFLFHHGMDQDFWYLLCRARSVNHLEKLHNSLPPNCRLLRDDFIKLKEFFKELPSLMKPRAAQLRSTRWETPEETDRITLNLFSARGRDLTDYYFHKLHDGRDCFDFRKETKAKLIGNPCIPSGIESFNVDLFDANFQAYCCFSKKMNQIGVRLFFWSNGLTEPLTFKLLSLPKSTFDYYSTGYQGNELVLSYAFSAEQVKKYLSRGTKHTVNIRRGQVEKFCEQLKLLLIESEIPAQSITTNIVKRGD